MRRHFTILFYAVPYFLFAQQKQDTTVLLQPIDLNIHFSKQSLLSATTSLHTLDAAAIQQQQPGNMLSALNTVAGVRMEERSPGSYRLAMRGSLIRSPFGIRNTKIYIDEFPLTDAGGNTYLNLIDANAIQSITILKGPDGSLYGANSGGIVKILPKGFTNTKDLVAINVAGGSFNTFLQQAEIHKKLNDKYQFSLNQSFTRSDGYRENTALNKKAIQTSHQWDYNKTNQIRFFAFYTDLAYETPGGLTQAQFDSNPRQARPATSSTPGASEQKAAIYNKTVFAGIAHRTQINESLTHHISIYGSKTDFKNPFITNYEVRDESTVGVRTYFSWNKSISGKAVQMQIGAEGNYGKNSIDNYDNDKGTATQKQAEDQLNNSNWNFFYRAQIELLKNWSLEGSLGLNTARIKYQSFFPTPDQGQIKFDTELMPRVASSYQYQNMAWRVSFAKGYSTPTIAEVRSSDNIINTNLQAEKGNNYEIGYKIKSANNRLLFDVAGYAYIMKNGIIRQTNKAGNEYFSNVGEMNQKGIESSIWVHIIQNTASIRNLTYQSSLAYNHYRFGQYISNGIDLKNKKITAVPDWVWTNTVSIDLPLDFKVNIYHNYTSTSPLNDANTVFAKKFNIVQLKVAKRFEITKKLDFQLYTGVDNLFNERYSLGNDINAFGGRYFNPAPTRNYYAGLKVGLL